MARNQTHNLVIINPVLQPLHPAAMATIHKHILLSFETQPPYPGEVLCNPREALFALLNNEPYNNTRHFEHTQNLLCVRTVQIQ